jgi:hypothetical protein
VLKSPSACKRSGSWSVDETGKFELNVSHEAGPWKLTGERNAGTRQGAAAPRRLTTAASSFWSRPGNCPPPARSTKAAVVYQNRTVVLSFTNPVFPLALQSVLGADKRLLRLYESGLPSWAIFLPTYGAL